MTVQDNHPSMKGKPRFFYGYVITACSLLISIAVLSAHNSFGVFFKPLIEEFGWSRGLLSGALSVGLILTGAFSVVMGWLSDKYGPRPIALFCGVVSGGAYIGMAHVTAIWQVYIFFGFLVGIGMSGTWVPLVTTIARWFDHKRGLMTGIFVTGVGIAPLLGPLATSWLLTGNTWQNSYLIIGITIMVVILICSAFLRGDPAHMGLFPDGAEKATEKAAKLRLEGYSLREAVGTAQFWLCLIMFLCMGYWYFSFLVHIVPYATDLGIPQVSAAGILSVNGATTIIGNIVLGSLSDRMGARRIMILSFITITASLFGLFGANQLWSLMLFAAVSGFAFGGFVAIESPLVALNFGLKSHGAIFAVIVFGMTIGSASGPLATGYIFDATGSYQYSFYIFAVLSVIALALSLIMRPTRYMREQQLQK